MGKQGLLPSPLHGYNTQQLVTAKGQKPVGAGDTRMSEFGYGRERMQKLHIEAILSQNKCGEHEARPGPGTHNISYQWSIPRDDSPSKTTPQYSFSKSRKDSREHFKSQIVKRRNLPGPGSYATPLDVPILQIGSPVGSSRRYHKTG